MQHDFHHIYSQICTNTRAHDDQTDKPNMFVDQRFSTQEQGI